jgi:hypothetical protein
VEHLPVDAHLERLASLERRHELAGRRALGIEQPGQPRPQRLPHGLGEEERERPLGQLTAWRAEQVLRGAIHVDDLAIGTDGDERRGCELVEQAQAITRRGEGAIAPLQLRVDGRQLLILELELGLTHLERVHEGSHVHVAIARCCLRGSHRCTIPSHPSPSIERG